MTSLLAFLLDFFTLDSFFSDIVVGLNIALLKAIVPK